MFGELPSIFSLVETVAIEKNYAAITDAISLELTYFSAKFIQHGFMRAKAASDITTIDGKGNTWKAAQLLNLAIQHINHNKKAFEKIIEVFSKEAAHSHLAEAIRNSYHGKE